MTDHDLYIEFDGGTVAVSITALTEGVGAEATDIAATLTEAYGDRVIER